MSLLGKLAALVSGGGEKKVCVVDGDRMISGDRMGPGERFQALNRLSKFAGREELVIHVVFGGRPLREAGDGDEYNGVHVYFGESPAEVKTRLFSLVSKAGAGKTVLASADPAVLEEAESKGVDTIRTSTLRKAMEASSDGPSRGEGGDHDRGGRGERGDRSDRGDRGGRDRGGRNRGRNRGGNRRPQQQGGDNNPSAEPSDDGSERSDPSSGESENQRPRNNPDPSVKSLIDLVD